MECNPLGEETVLNKKLLSLVPVIPVQKCHFGDINCKFNFLKRNVQNHLVIKRDLLALKTSIEGFRENGANNAKSVNSVDQFGGTIL